MKDKLRKLNICFTHQNRPIFNSDVESYEFRKMPQTYCCGCSDPYCKNFALRCGECAICRVTEPVSAEYERANLISSKLLDYG